MTFKAWQSDGRALLDRLCVILQAEGIDADRLVGAAENPAYDKFDAYIPAELLRRAYVVERLCPEEVLNRFLGNTWEEEENG